MENGITVAENVVVTEKTITKKVLIIDEISQRRMGNFWTAHIKARTVDQDGKTLETKDMLINAAEYDAFWNGYNSGSYIVGLLYASFGITEPIPENVEDYFLNSHA